MAEIKSPIAVFDSGIGGLTVLRALKACYPHESYVYLGDTARLPYGTKSPETVIRYSETLCRALLPYKPKAIVIACSTASTHAEAAVQKLAGDIPVVGVIEPTAEAALSATKNSHIAVIGTFGTIRKGAYENALRTLSGNKASQEVKVSSRACQMLVSLAEEGWSGNAIARATIHEYLDPLFDRADAPDTLILGCTHFPVFAALFREILGDSVALIDSGVAAAHKLEKIVSVERHEPALLKILATDDPERFAVNAARFFDVTLTGGDVEQVDVSA
jgi:glutamate racemase